MVKRYYLIILLKTIPCWTMEDSTAISLEENIDEVQGTNINSKDNKEESKIFINPEYQGHLFYRSFDGQKLCELLGYDAYANIEYDKIYGGKKRLITNLLNNDKNNPALYYHRNYISKITCIKSIQERVITALSTAKNAKDINLNMLRKAIDQGINPNTKGTNGRTLLISLVVQNDLEYAAKIITPLNINCPSYNKWTPLQDAMERGKLDMTKLLISRGANFTTKGEGDLLPIEGAIKNHQKEIFNYIFYDPEIPLKDRMFAATTAAIYALTTAENAHEVDIDILKAAIELKIDPFTSGKNGRSLMIALVARNDIESVKKIIAQIGDNKDRLRSLLNSRSYYDWTPLQSAIKVDIEMVKLLVANGANPNTVGKNGKTAIEYAREHGQKDILNYLESI